MCVYVLIFVHYLYRKIAKYNLLKYLQEVAVWVVQLVECQRLNLEVPGSIPGPSKIFLYTFYISYHIDKLNGTFEYIIGYNGAW